MSKMSARGVAVLTALVTCASVAGGQATERRIALVIGNGAYTHLTRLGNPENDARDVAAALGELGFSVTTLTHAGIAEMEESVREFARKLSRDSGSAGVFFYAGHAVQSGGENYLIPVDADIRTEVELKRKALSAQEVLAYMDEARNRFNMLVLDACRDNPFAGSFRSAARGLAVVGSAPPETVVVYATAAGATAEDGSGRNSPFTAALLKHIRTPGIDAEAMLRRVTAEVQGATANRQTPYRYSSLASDFRFVQAADTERPALSAGSGAVAPKPAAPLMAVEMVLVDGGTFQMGDAVGGGQADERPVRSVTLATFSLARYEVTQSQWVSVMGSNPSAFAGNDRPAETVSWVDAADFCNRLSAREGRQPCYTISGTSVACDFSKDGYRLPTEAEWEYASRGGASSRGYRYAGANELEAVGWYSPNSGKATHPVGGKRANELGIYDMTGNVSEWCWDWYGPYTTQAQADPRGPPTGTRRVIRGGSWLTEPDRYLRVAARNGNELPVGWRSSDVGLRLAHSVVVERKPVVAVSAFKAAGVSEPEARAATQRLEEALVATGMFTLIAQPVIQTVLQEIGESAATDEGVSVRIGRLLSADAVARGTIGAIGDRYYVGVELVDAATGVVLTTQHVLRPSYGEAVLGLAGLAGRLSLPGSAPGATGRSSGLPRAVTLPAVLEGLSRAEGVVLDALFHAGLQESGRVSVLSEADRDLLLEGQQAEISECSDDAAAVAIGRLLAVDRAVLTYAGRADARCYFRARLIDVATGAILAVSSTERPTIEEMADDIVGVAHELVVRQGKP